MTELERALTTALRDAAEEVAMSTDMNDGRETLERHLDDVDRRRQNRRIGAGLVAAAAVVAIVVGFAAWPRGSEQGPPIQGGPSPTSASPTPTPSPTPSPTEGFRSTTFGIPFVADLPHWAGSLDTEPWPTSQQREWVTWNRCPDGTTECIGLSFNRYRYVLDTATSTYVKPTYATYLAYLEKLRKDGSIDITERTTTTVGGRPATLLAVTGRANLSYGIGCHTDLSCDDFIDGVPGYYAVVDARGLDPDGEVLVIWTRAGVVAAPETAWVEDFRSMLAGLQFRSR